MKEKNGEHPFGDAGQLVLLGLFLVVWVGDSFLLRISTLVSDSLPLYVRLIFLSVTLTLGFYLFGTSHNAVCHESRPAGVISTGAFRYVRHPLYLAGMLCYLGLSVSTASLISFGLLVIIFMFYNYIASYEEKLLELKYGGEYRSYKKKTGKWLPKIGREE